MEGRPPTQRSTWASNVGWPGNVTTPSAAAAVRTHLEGTVWPELRTSAAEHGRAVGMTDDDLATLAALTDPADPRHAADQPGHFVVQPAVPITGRRPD